MPAVPCIKTSILREADKTNVRVSEGLLKVSRFKRTQQHDPSIVERFQERERHVDWSRSGVTEERPSIFVIWLDGWLVFGERQLETTVAVEVAVRHVMDHLTNSPTSRAIWRIELLVSQSFRRCPQLPGRFGDLNDCSSDVVV